MYASVHLLASLPSVHESKVEYSLPNSDLRFGLDPPRVINNVRTTTHLVVQDVHSNDDGNQGNRVHKQSMCGLGILLANPRSSQISRANRRKKSSHSSMRSGERPGCWANYGGGSEWQGSVGEGDAVCARRACRTGVDR